MRYFLSVIDIYCKIKVNIIVNGEILKDFFLN